jgi:hypothetical protein
VYPRSVTATSGRLKGVDNVAVMAVDRYNQESEITYANR